MEQVIKFIENQSPYYSERTKENIMLADKTILLSLKESPGIRLTRKLVIEKAKKIWKPIDEILFEYSLLQPDLPYQLISYIEKFWLKEGSLKINIAGNGADTLFGSLNQQRLDQFLIPPLSRIFSHKEIIQVTSGGQTGVDESGLKAAMVAKMKNPNLKITCIAPKGFRFRKVDGTDIYNKELFINRFTQFREKQMQDFLLT